MHSAQTSSSSSRICGNRSYLAFQPGARCCFANSDLIGHPCTVLRCQVHEYARTAHLLPFNLVPVVGQHIKKRIALHTAHFLVYKFTYDTVYGIARGYVSRKMPENRTCFHTIIPEMYASITAGLVADLVCFSQETVVHRLYIQDANFFV
ncbi:SLC (SoLute Carrier) like protein [Ditylenchus destructor]|nr:SLC (SoLute Carrier) like protein [Ditylenchus destructor]